MLRLLRAAIDTYRTDGGVSTFRQGVRHIHTKEIPGLIRWIRYTIRRLKYHDAAPKSTQLLYIQPEQVKYVVWPGFYSDLSREYTHIRSGTWDKSIVQKETGHWDNFDRRSLIPFEKYIPYRSFVEHFRDGVPWQETDYFKNATSDPERDRLGTTSSPRWEKFEQWDDVYESMKEEGYKIKEDRSMSLFNSPGDEILIDIGRDGQLILDDGRHRLMIAKILGINQIPVRVLVRHEQWQNRKEAFLSSKKSSDYSQELSNHPDLKPLLS